MSWSPDKKELSVWLPVCSLSFAAFVFVTSELMPIGLLPGMARDLARPEWFIGWVVTIYAWGVALLSLPLTVLTEKVDRRRLLLILLGIFIVGNLLTAVTQSFWMLLFSRVCIACAHAVFWSITTPLAARLAPQRRQTRALTIVITGASLATVLGVPAGTMVGVYTNWRIAFALTSLVAAVVFIILLRMLPPLPSVNTSNLKTLPTLFRKKLLLKLYVVTLLLISGNFVAFTYLTPFLKDVVGIDLKVVPYILLTLGVSGIFGSMIASRYSDRQPYRVMLPGVLMVGVCLLLLRYLTFSHVAEVMLCIIWGASLSAAILVLQSQVLRVAGNSGDAAISMYSGIFNIGIGLGAFVGGKCRCFSPCMR